MSSVASLHKQNSLLNSSRSNMSQSLYQRLQVCKSEEDVKEEYIQALGLKGVSRNLIDIQTKEIWFEAKDGTKESIYAMFTQLLHYVKQALNEGEYVPPFLCVIDCAKAAIMKTEDVLPFLEQKTIKWGKSASNYTQEALDAVSGFIGTHFVSFRIETHEQEFIETVKNAIKTGEIIRTQITPGNLKTVFDKWVLMIGREIKDVSEDKYNLLFFADVMSDGTVSTHTNLPAELIHRNGNPSFLLDGRLYELGNQEGYRRFWAIYDRPPKEEYRNYLLERRDSLIPIDERQFHGAYYTPLDVVDKAYEYLTATLGNNWQRDYIVWDMCCGVGNLETKHTFPRNVYMSTLDQNDVDVMIATKTCVRAERFQYDYLNDDITEDGSIDYSLTNKMPDGLRTAIINAREGKPGAKKILVLINPPYGEATNAENASRGSNAKNKAEIKRTKMADVGMLEYGKSSNELFVQFIARIAKEIPTATLAMFSKMKYINAQASEPFRKAWNAKFINGFVIHNKAFDGLKGNFPIGFLIWKTDNRPGRTRTPISEVRCDVFNKNVRPSGSKLFYNLPTERYLSRWIERPKSNKKECVPLTSAITPPKGNRKDQRGTKWSDDAVGYLCTGTNDFQHQRYINLLSSPASMGHGIFVNATNLLQCAVYFTMTTIIHPTWLNDIDQFLQPNVDLPEDFLNDCLIWMLFNNNNNTASANGLQWNNRSWSIVNHFIPFNEDEVGAPGRFESDFMVQFIEGRVFSQEAKEVINQGRKLWQAYFSMEDEYQIRDKYKLNRPDVGWYQIRNALVDRNDTGNYKKVSFSEFEKAYQELTDKLKPEVYEKGFLKY